MAISYSTQLQVRVIAKGGKFLGDDIGAALVTVHHAQTGALLASGQLTGGSGDLWDLMVNPRPRTQPLPVEGASVFVANIVSDSQAPVPLRITATGPGAGLQSAATVSTTQWIVPGMLDADGNPVLFSCQLELPGLLLQVMQPPTHLNISQALPQTVNFEVNVAMMCGCPIDNALDKDGSHSFPNPWPTNDFVVGCIVECAGNTVTQFNLAFDEANAPGRYTGQWKMSQPGFYTAHLYAYQLSTGNTGTATVSFFQIPVAK